MELSSYLSSKRAIFAYFNVLRQELKQQNRDISVSIACPYTINTTLFEGYKTKVDLLFPVLDENYVGIRLIKEFVARKEVCFVGRRHALMMKLLNLFPSTFQDWFYIHIIESDFSAKKK